ncbi:hypothetical protein [Lysinibacillus sp. Ag94]|uniref:hypothetical protein n=1 Tax=Lysinibacillus sp. Ag94 TaxID=2936682 RepID=UPI00200C12AC|nr:hypothetical protein [Lysinibacillus sp. Ag94]UPW82254.1 hypothetical protein MY533_16075 [Lysinibacillus sp. Ag94]
MVRAYESKGYDKARSFEVLLRVSRQVFNNGWLNDIAAGTQIRRDSWVPQLNTYVSDCALYSTVQVPEENE